MILSNRRAGKTNIDKKRNEIIGRMVKQQVMLQKLEEWQPNWYRHINRMEPETVIETRKWERKENKLQEDLNGENLETTANKVKNLTEIKIIR